MGVLQGGHAAWEHQYYCSSVDQNFLQNHVKTPEWQMPLALELPKLNTERFVMKKILVEELAGGGRMELYEDKKGGLLVGKRFPASILGEGPEDYAANHPSSLQNPWQELALTAMLGSTGLKGVCHCHGHFRDSSGDVLLMMEYLPGGDLFDLVSQMGQPSADREQQVWYLLLQLLSTVTSLHHMGVAHCDVSLENVLVKGGKRQEIVLIDFEAAVVDGIHFVKGKRGKPSYQAPEMHSDDSYDACAADLFSIGVCAYCLAIGNYPWTTTRPGGDTGFTFAQTNGIEAFLAKKRFRHPNGERGNCVRDYLSPDFRYLLSLLLNMNPAKRFEALWCLQPQTVAYAMGDCAPGTLMGA